MNIKLTACAAIAVLLISCQKEASYETGTTPGGNSGGGNSDGTLLVRAVGINSTDSISTVYAYDSQKRLETVTDDGIQNGDVYHRYKKYVRDGAGRIIRILNQVSGNGISSDTLVDYIHYPNATTMEFDYDVIDVDQSGFKVKDSTVYSYSGGKMQSATVYMEAPDLGNIFAALSRIDFEYDGSGNVSRVKFYGNNGNAQSPLDYTGNQVFTYGTMQNAQWTSPNAAQNLLINQLPNATNAAMTQLVFTNLADPGAGGTVNHNYTAGTNNRPATDSVVTVGDSDVTRIRYYYQ